MGALIRTLALAAALIAPGLAAAQAERAAEIQIKAAFLYKFGGFIEWPPAAFERAESAFAIGVLGADAMAAELDRATAGRMVQGRRVAVRKLRRGRATGRAARSLRRSAGSREAGGDPLRRQRHACR